MKKILLSLGSLIFAGALLAGGTIACINNVHAADWGGFNSGSFDLKVDNESYKTNDVGVLTKSAPTSWDNPSSLNHKLFFNFTDLKPGDFGGDTVSLHTTADAWLCMSLTLTNTFENGQTEPEKLDDATAQKKKGELQKQLNFFFWMDDGDTVYEKGEKIFKQGTAQTLFDGTYWPLTDSHQCVWGKKEPLKSRDLKYVGVGWCYGNLTPAGIVQDGKGKTSTNSPLTRGTGFVCEGSQWGNKAQTDSIALNVALAAVQAKGNGHYRCGAKGHQDDHEDDETHTRTSSHRRDD